VTPETLLYSKTHEWIRLETGPAGQQTATLGISAFAVEQLADLVGVDLPRIGRRVIAGEPLGELESAKAVSDFYSPVEGEIIEVNSQLAESPDSLAKDPYGSGWLVRIRLSGQSGLAELLDYAAYRKQCEEPTTDGQ
jgi:glycine cleavage system H protein